MKKGQILEGIVEKVEFPGKGRITAEGRTFTVKGAIEGQKVRFMVSKVRSGKCEGRILEVLQKAPCETEPDCPHFEYCGGCSLRNLPYKKQLELKEKQVKELLESVCPDPHFEGIQPSPVTCGYRNKMEFSFGDACKDGQLELGLHKRGSFYDIVTVDHCRIADEDFSMILKAVLKLARESTLPYFRKNSHVGYFRHLLIRKAHATGEILVDLVTSSQIAPEKEQLLLAGLIQTLIALPLTGRIVGILHTINDREADAVVSDRTDLLYGTDYYFEELMGLRFRISIFSFFQNNTPGAELLYSAAREYAGDTKDKIIFDLYSGTGTIAQILAPVARSVTGVEIVEEAVEAARENASLNGLQNCCFIAGDVLKVVDSLEEKPDVIILDPPRDGIHPKAIWKILAFGVEKIVYISCKPTSLIRDLEIFQANGYQVERSLCCDLFPGTLHVETVVLLSKGVIG